MPPRWEVFTQYRARASTPPKRSGVSSREKACEEEPAAAPFAGAPLLLPGRAEPSSAAPDGCRADGEGRRATLQHEAEQPSAALARNRQTSAPGAIQAPLREKRRFPATRLPPQATRGDTQLLLPALGGVKGNPRWRQERRVLPLHPLPQRESAFRPCCCSGSQTPPCY